MNEPESSPRKHEREDEKKRQEQTRRQFHFAISYLITSLILLWLFQLLFLIRLPETPKSLTASSNRNWLTGSDCRCNHRRNEHRWRDEKPQPGRISIVEYPIQHHTCAWWRPQAH